VGYNYLDTMPLGITFGGELIFGLSLMYLSANFGSGNSGDENALGVEWTCGIAFPITNWLRIPIGVGGNHIGRKEETTNYSTLYGYTTYEDNEGFDWEHMFVIEAGLQVIIAKFFYVTTTYRLRGFSGGGLSLGVGVVF
jgi:hypothetical protein